ncbi:SPFH domain-containing protein [Kribbella sp. NPDC000426]|uniref:SPFH domain-containing protein n=1 Tax=Kribbella sp. NPDC000426 TaxID=3154255 RepID=UPI00331B8B93
MQFTTPVLAAPIARPWAILAALLVLAAVAAIEPRVVPRSRWLAVLRAGRVARVVTAGLTIRVPLLERYVWLPRACTRRPLVVTSRSLEGVEVRISGEVGIRIVDPAAAVENSLLPTDLALDEIERSLARTVARCDVAALAELPAFLELAIDVPGVQVTAVDVGSVEVVLSPLALRSLADQTK